MFSATNIVGSTARAMFASSRFSANNLYVECAIWGAVDLYCGSINRCGECCGLLGVGCWNLWS